MVGSEAPFMAFGAKAGRQVFTAKIDCSGYDSFCLTVWLVCQRAIPSMADCLVLLQGMVNGVLLVEYMKYISSVVNPRVIGIAVSAFTPSAPMAVRFYVISLAA